MTPHLFTLQVRRDRVVENRQRHGDVRPEMPAVLRTTGWSACTRHLRDDGRLVGVVGTYDLDARLDARTGTDPQENRS